MARTTKKHHVSHELQQLASAVDALPDEIRQTLSPLLLKVSEANDRRHRLNRLIQEALSQLRLDIKYLEFDLEATRRERDAYHDELTRLDGEL